jgi:gentisate 1,2-dioxygenase
MLLFLLSTVNVHSIIFFVKRGTGTSTGNNRQFLETERHDYVIVDSNPKIAGTVPK